MAVYLPKINYMEIYGFDKIFKEDQIRIDFNAPLNIILGGNGLGKTTLLQCIVYALTGGLNSHEVEKDKNFRWSFTFFRGRVNQDKVSTATITVNFNLGVNVITVKRGLISNRILNYSLESNNEHMGFNTYEDLITELGGYDEYNSFVFLVNRLLYLPENRRSLTWDYDGQIRSLMILSNDIVNEKKYHDLRTEIKKLDSAKRHKTVSINKYQNDIDKLREKNDSIPEVKANPIGELNIEDTFAKRHSLNERLQGLLNNRDTLSQQLKEYLSRRNELAEEISTLSDQIRSYEAKTIIDSLERISSRDTLLYGKTINKGICPCCGDRSLAFQKLVRERLLDSRCIICGEIRTLESTFVDGEEVSLYNSQLNEKLLARDNANKHILYLRNQLQSIDEEIFIVRKEISAIDYSSFINEDRNDEHIESEDDIDEITEQLAKLISDRNSLESDIMIKTAQADQLYETFRNSFSDRNIQLSSIYKNLASAFLGKEVTLQFERSMDKFVDFDYLIPCFDNEIRKSPEDCSEAQRFFLDIAFRMSLIVLNYQLTGASATFICETPESALDVSYIDNVVKMFFNFTKNNNSLILSNNLQKFGLASLLVKKYSDNDNSYTIFDLLHYGRLSDVQSNSKELFEIRNEIIGGSQKRYE